MSKNINIKATVIDFTVIILGALIYDTKIVVMGVVGTHFCGMMVNHFIFGFELKRRVCMISAKHDAFMYFILNALHSDATVCESYGAYDNTWRKEIVTIADKTNISSYPTLSKRQPPWP